MRFVFMFRNSRRLENTSRKAIDITKSKFLLNHVTFKKAPHNIVSFNFNGLKAFRIFFRPNNIQENWYRQTHWTRTDTAEFRTYEFCIFTGAGSWVT